MKSFCRLPSDELAAIKELVKETMESAIELAVPLEADENEAKHGMKPNKIEFVQKKAVGDFSVSYRF